MRKASKFMCLAMFCCWMISTPSNANADQDYRSEILTNWYRMILELVRHTPTYSPPVASRSFAYTAIIAFEATASGSSKLQSLTGQVTGLGTLPSRDPAAEYDDSIVLNAAMARAVDVFFSNTGPTGQRAKAALASMLNAKIAKEVDTETAARSNAFGFRLSEHVIAVSMTDGGATVKNLGFPLNYSLGGKPESWTPTNTIGLQQTPLLPEWGKNRPLALPDNQACALPPPPAYSQDPLSSFYLEAMEVYETTKNLTDEQKRIARFWSDDPMLSPTPPGHWVAILQQIIERDALSVEQQVDAFVRLGIAVSDGFIVNWRDKYRYDLVRPLTYIRQVIDPSWNTLLNTPPFPEYPSGHSTQSGAAAQVLSHVFGEAFAFTDATHTDDGMAVRAYPDFWSAANEAGISRLYGGIHFRSAIDLGLEQGACVGNYINALRTWK